MEYGTLKIEWRENDDGTIRKLWPVSASVEGAFPAIVGHENTWRILSWGFAEGGVLRMEDGQSFKVWQDKAPPWLFYAFRNDGQFKLWYWWWQFKRRIVATLSVLKHFTIWLFEVWGFARTRTLKKVEWRDIYFVEWICNVLDRRYA